LDGQGVRRRDDADNGDLYCKVFFADGCGVDPEDASSITDKFTGFLMALFFGDVKSGWRWAQDTAVETFWVDIPEENRLFCGFD